MTSLLVAPGLVALAASTADGFPSRAEIDMMAGYRFREFRGGGPVGAARLQAPGRGRASGAGGGV